MKKNTYRVDTLRQGKKQAGRGKGGQAKSERHVAASVQKSKEHNQIEYFGIWENKPSANEEDRNQCLFLQRPLP